MLDQESGWVGRSKNHFEKGTTVGTTTSSTTTSPSIVRDDPLHDEIDAMAKLTLALTTVETVENEPKGRPLTRKKKKRSGSHRSRKSKEIKSASSSIIRSTTVASPAKIASGTIVKEPELTAEQEQDPTSASKVDKESGAQVSVAKRKPKIKSVPPFTTMYLAGRRRVAHDALAEAMEKSFVKSASDYDEVRLERLMDTNNTGEFDDFYDTFVHLVSSMTPEDADSMHTGEPTQACQRFINFVQSLPTVYGFPENSRPDDESRVVFWSGENGHKKAKNFKSKTVFARRPYLMLMNIVITKTTQEKDPIMCNKLNVMLSAIYAKKSSGDVHAYIATNKRTPSDRRETSAIIVGSHFWDGELPQLRLAQAEGDVDKIHIHPHHAAEGWSHSYDLDDDKAQGNILLVRRHAYEAGTLLDDDAPDRFVPRVQSSKGYKEFTESEARPSISVLKIREIFGRWKEKARNQKHSRQSSVDASKPTHFHSVLKCGRREESQVYVPEPKTKHMKQTRLIQREASFS